ERIVSGGTDETKVSRLDVGQKDILLRLVEMMNLINKEDRPLSGRAETITGRGEHTAHFADVAFHPANPNKFGMGQLRNDAPQAWLQSRAIVARSIGSLPNTLWLALQTPNT